MQTLLIVEDEKMIRQGIKVMIQRSGVPVEHILECNNGEAALEILKNQKVDVMFTDIRMPKMDGIELVKAMQTLSHIPLTVAISGYDDFSYAVEMLRKGVREYLLKPIEREKVTEILKTLHAELEEHKSIGYQQLKYFMLNDETTIQEQEHMVKQYGNLFLGNTYVVCCLASSAEVLQKGEHFICLSDVENQDVYVVETAYFQQVADERFQNRNVGVSNSYSGMDTLKQAYREAKRARKEAFYLCKPVCYYQDMTMDEKEGGISLEEKSIKHIVWILGTDKWEEGLRQLSRIFQNARLGSYSLNDIEHHIHLFLEEVLSVYQTVIHMSQAELKPLYDIYSYQNSEELEQEWIEWLKQLSVILNSQFEDYKNKQKIQQAVLFIRENYQKDLNMAVVSNQISMNYSLFSYLFKQYTGNNFVNYLKDLRLEEAKRLLEHTEMKIIEISQKVGYDNEKHFMKIFKNECGVSPTEYRKTCIKNCVFERND